MVTRADVLAQIERLKQQLEASQPTQCEGCTALLTGDTCEYCGRIVELPLDADLPDEPPDIRRTNASDDPCSMCGLVHSIDPYALVICRCQKCGQIAPVAISTYDPLFGHGVVCHACCSGQAPASISQQSGFAPISQAAEPWKH